MKTLFIEAKKNARPTVEIQLPDGRILSGKRNLPLSEFLRALPEWSDPQIVGAVVNGELRELTYPIDSDARVTPVTMADADGARIYRRSITFLLETAFQQIFPKGHLTVDHSVSSGGFYCKVLGRKPLTIIELEKIKSKMDELVAANLPFDRKLVPLADAIRYFQQQGHSDKIRLLKYRQKTNLVLYQLGEHFDYHHGYMVPSTGYLRWYALRLSGEGFILQFPRRHAPSELSPMSAYPKLLATFRQYGDWLTKLGIESVGALNDAIEENRAPEIILVSEALHEQKIAQIANTILAKANKARIILISGPSSSGKTTFSKRLAIQLLTHGISPFPLEMDNYFVNRELTPKDANGDYDFESLGALDKVRLNNDLQNLINGNEVQLPKYLFKEGHSIPGEVVKIRKDQLIILEGIHGLNPQLLPGMSPSQTFLIYVSCLTQLNLDSHNRISTTDTRLIRRIVRDAQTRGYNAQQTIQRWESVRRGEKLNIFPYQENADELFNSALVFELSVLKTLVEPLLRQVPYGTQEHIEAKRLLALLEWFLPVQSEWVPDNSILREFIGGSILSNFKLWENGKEKGGG